MTKDPHATPDPAAMTEREVQIVSHAEQTPEWNEAQADVIVRTEPLDVALDRAMRTAAVIALRVRDRGELDDYIDQVRELAHQGVVDASLPDRLRHAVENAHVLNRVGEVMTSG